MVIKNIAAFVAVAVIATAFAVAPIQAGEIPLVKGSSEGPALMEKVWPQKDKPGAASAPTTVRRITQDEVEMFRPFMLMEKTNTWQPVKAGTVVRFDTQGSPIQVIECRNAITALRPEWWKTTTEVHVREVRAEPEIIYVDRVVYEEVEVTKTVTETIHTDYTLLLAISKREAVMPSQPVVGGNIAFTSHSLGSLHLSKSQNAVTNLSLQQIQATAAIGGAASTSTSTSTNTNTNTNSSNLGGGGAGGGQIGIAAHDSAAGTAGAGSGSQGTANISIAPTPN